MPSIAIQTVCELETQILLAGDLDLIENGEWDTLKKHCRNRKNVKIADKVFRKHTSCPPMNCGGLNPCPLESLDPWILFSNKNGRTCPWTGLAYRLYLCRHSRQSSLSAAGNPAGVFLPFIKVAGYSFTFDKIHEHIAVDAGIVIEEECLWKANKMQPSILKIWTE